MITRTEIRRLSNSASYKRGLDIYRSDSKIKEFTVEEEDAKDFIKALIKGQRGSLYDVKVIYDKEKDIVDTIYCDCPAFYSYNGICKHCVAVLLEYVDFINRQKALERYAAQRERATAPRQILKKSGDEGLVQLRPASLQTTAAMKQLLDKQFLKKTVPITQKDIYGKICVEPYLKCVSSSYQVEFKIGYSQMYVLKDVFEFSDNIKRGVDYTYGKNLRFVHLLEMFEQDSRELIRFIQDWTEKNRRNYVQSSYLRYNYNATLPKLRTMPLTGEELEGLLNAVGGKAFTVNFDYKGDEIWHMEKASPVRRLMLKGKADGLEVSIDHIPVIRGKYEDMYFENQCIYMLPKEELAPVSDFLSCMAELQGHTAYIQGEDVPSFCRDLLPVLEKHFECTREHFSEQDYGVVPVTFEIYLDAPQKDYITFKILAVYEDKKYNVFDKNADRGTRDIVKELEQRKMISIYTNAFDEEGQMLVLSQDEERMYELLTEGIPRMQEWADVYVSDALRRIKVVESPKVVVGVSIAGEMLELRMTAEDMPQDVLLEILSKYDRRKKFYRLRSGEFVNVADDSLEALLELKEGLYLTDRQLKKDNITVPKYRALYLDAELRERQELPVVKDKAFKSLIRNMKTIEDNEFDIPDEQMNILREYQKRGYLWIKTLKHNGFGGILADDMGLGKTLQVITFLWSEYLESGEDDNKSCLVVAPASLVFNWGSEIERFAPGLPVKLVVGNASEREEVIRSAGNRDVLVTSYELLKRDIEHYSDIVFDCQVIDEAQYIKNHNTQAAKTVKQIEAGFKLALTGTPVENKLSELWSIFDYLMPGFLYVYDRFRKDLEIPVVQDGSIKAMARLQKMIRPFILRRLKKDVLKDLPDKIEKNMYARLEGEQRELYDAHVQRLKLMLDKQTDEEFRTSRFQILSELTKLRQICCNPALLYENYKGNSGKTEMCMELIQNAINGGHKILLFSQFTSMLEEIQQELNREGISYYTLTGATSKEKRSELVKAFNQDETSVFCISLKAGGTGLNLTAADIVIHYDPWWNLAVQNQATDRAHRIGQKKVVSVYKLIVKESIEENIMKVQDKKKELADQLLSGEGMDSGSFSREEVLGLLR